MTIRATSVRLLLVLAGLLVFTGAAALAQAPRTWTATGSMGTSRRFPIIERLPDGRFLVAGGTHTTGVDFSATQFFNTAEIFDPATGTWSATGSMATARSSATSAILPDGKILVAGGRNLASAALNSAEIFKKPLVPKPSITSGVNSV